MNKGYSIYLRLHLSVLHFYREKSYCYWGVANTSIGVTQEDLDKKIASARRNKIYFKTEKEAKVAIADIKEYFKINKTARWKPKLGDCFWSIVLCDDSLGGTHIPRFTSELFEYDEDLKKANLFKNYFSTKKEAEEFRRDLKDYFIRRRLTY